MVEQGVINASQGAELLIALGGPGEIQQDSPQALTVETEDEPANSEPESTQPAEATPQEQIAARSPETPPNLEKWRHWWIYPWGAGIAITTISAVLLYQGLQNQWASIWLACIWLPLLFGILVVGLAWFSRSVRWLHLRVNTGQDEWPRKIAISFPLPIRATAWFLRLFGNHIPRLEGTGLDEFILVLGESTTPEAPLYVEVDEGDSGEKVQVYIG